MAYGFNDDKSKFDITDVARTGDIADVVRTSDITDVVRTGDISQKVYEDKITIIGSSQFKIEHSRLVVQSGGMAYVSIILSPKSNQASGWKSVPIKLPDDMLLLRVYAGHTAFPIGADSTTVQGPILQANLADPTYAEMDVLAFNLTSTWQTTMEPYMFYGIVMLWDQQ